jgi:hypothetical protein
MNGGSSTQASVAKQRRKLELPLPFPEEEESKEDFCSGCGAHLQSRQHFPFCNQAF